METLETFLETIGTPRLSVGQKWKHKWKHFPKWKHLTCYLANQPVMQPDQVRHWEHLNQCLYK
jgi:hypothetical protein